MICEKLVYAYCREDISLIENYENAINDKTQTWHCHHRRETIFSRKDLIEIGEYYNRPACELIFLTKSEHMKLHHLGKPSGMKDKHPSEESRKKMSEKKKGENNPLFGKHHSAETCKKISEANKGKHLSAEACKKIAEALKSRTFSEETRKKLSVNNGRFWKGKRLSEETRKKLSESHKGKHWYNNGDTSILAKTCPEGFVKGRLKLCAKASLVTSS